MGCFDAIPATDITEENDYTNDEGRGNTLSDTIRKKKDKKEQSRRG